MSEFEQRRGLLRSAAAWIGGLAAVTAVRSAGAFEIEKIDPASPLGAAIANRCGEPSQHAALIAQLKAQLAQDPSADSLAATCPICGCPVIVSR